MSKVKQMMIDHEERRERAATLRGQSVTPIDAINTLDEWVGETLQSGEGVNDEMEWDLIKLQLAISNLRSHL